MTTTVIAVLVYRAFSVESIYTLKLKRLGIDYLAGREGDPLATVTVGEALNRSVVSAHQDFTIREMMRLIARTGREWFPVLDGARDLVGVVTYRDVAKAVDEGRLDERVSDHMTIEVVRAFSDENLRDVLIRFSRESVGHLPVVDPADPTRLIGIISHLDINRVYHRVLARRQRTRRNRR
jgi:CIC family chloride channel protein